jgi:CSLREA domain-containing protein
MGDEASVRLHCRAVVGVLLLWAIMAAPARAGVTINVNTTTDETTANDGTCSLREAVLCARPRRTPGPPFVLIRTRPTNGVRPPARRVRGLCAAVTCSAAG